MKLKESYRWVICGAATLMIFCAVGIGCSAFAFHLPYVRSVNGFSNTQTSMLLTIQSFSSITVSLLIDRYYRRFSLRAGITFSMVLFLAAYLTYSAATTYFIFCIGAVLSGISSCLAGSTAATFLINTWFKDHRAFALGIATAGTGLSSVIVPPILVPIIEGRSLSAAFRVEAAFILAATVFLFFVIRKGPYTMSGTAAPAAHVPAESTEKPRTLFRFTGHRLVMFMVGIFICGFLVHGTTAALSLILQENFSGTQRASLVSIFGLSVMAGKIFFGRLADRFGVYRTNYLFFAFLGAGLALVCVARQFPLGVAAVLFLGLGSPFVSVSIASFVGDLSHREHFPTALKYCSLNMAIARMIFTTVAGTSADLFGSYVPLFAFMLALTPISAFLIQRTYVYCGYHRKER